MTNLATLTAKIQATLDAHADYVPLPEYGVGHYHKPDCDCDYCEEVTLRCADDGVPVLRDEVVSLPEVDAMCEKRIALIVEKHESGLSPYQEAELLAIEEVVDELLPRYTQADFDLLNEAVELIAEFDRINPAPASGRGIDAPQTPVKGQP